MITSGKETYMKTLVTVRLLGANPITFYVMVIFEQGNRWDHLTHFNAQYHKTRVLTIFTSLHVMQPRYGEEISVCPTVRLSVCRSVTRVDCDKTVERSVQIYIPYERTFIPSFLRKRMAGGRRPLLPEILGQPTRVRTKSPIFNQ